MAANTEETLAELSVSEDQVKEFLEAQTVAHKIEHALRDEAPIEITDEEVNQSSFMYIAVEKDADSEEETVDENGEAVVPVLPTLVEVIGTPEEAGRDIIIDVTGDGFLYNMVRIITGTLVEAGSGKIDPASVGAIIEGRDRAAAGHTAPPQGLWLRKVLRKEAGPACPAEEPEKEAVAEE